MRCRRTLTICVALAGVAPTLIVAGCGGTTASSGAELRVVAAENFWGNIATQLAGKKAGVHSIIVDPAQDPHAYEPTPSDARALATARLAIVNGVGYDPWATKLLAANPAPGRDVLDVGQLLGLHEGDNPHRWYDPADVDTVVRAITARLKALSPGNSAYFDAARMSFEQTGLAQYRALIAAIGARYAGVPVGASESIFALLSPSLRLNLLTPPSFMKAITEGTEVTARDTATTQRQIAAHQIKVWIYNVQNATPQIQRLNTLARAAGIPIATLTETLTPASASFEHWQVAQLRALARALHQATER
jgi:zinc/manganese transport system substrate-binding protein